MLLIGCWMGETKNVEVSKIWEPTTGDAMNVEDEEGSHYT